MPCCCCHHLQVVSRGCTRHHSTPAAPALHIRVMAKITVQPGFNPDSRLLVDDFPVVPHLGPEWKRCAVHTRRLWKGPDVQGLGADCQDASLRAWTPWPQISHQRSESESEIDHYDLCVYNREVSCLDKINAIIFVARSYHRDFTAWSDAPQVRLQLP